MIKELNFSIEKQDIKDLAKDLLYVKKYKKQRIISSIVAVIIVFALSVFIAKNIDLAIITGMLCSVFVFIIEFCFAYPKELEIKMILFNKGRDLSKNIIKINSDENYLTFCIKDAEGKWDWKGVKNIYNEKYNILLFVAECQMIYIPKRIFNSEEEMNETWNLIQECYNKSR